MPAILETTVSEMEVRPCSLTSAASLPLRLTTAADRVVGVVVSLIVLPLVCVLGQWLVVASGPFLTPRSCGLRHAFRHVLG